MDFAEKQVDNFDAIVDKVIATTLGIGEAEVNDTLGYHSIPKWDSSGHVQLMLALETALDIRIQEHDIQNLHNVKAIRAFVKGVKLHSEFGRTISKIVSEWHRSEQLLAWEKKWLGQNTTWLQAVSMRIKGAATR